MRWIDLQTPPKAHELRCFCSRTPLLATYGFDAKGLYVHVKVYKQSRIYGEIFSRGGTIEIKCRECLRWYTVSMSSPNKAELTEQTHPSIVDVDSLPEPMLDAGPLLP